MPHQEYSLPDTLERIYENQLALEAAIMELSLWSNRNGGAFVDEIFEVPWRRLARTLGISKKKGLARLKQKPSA